MAEKKNKPFDGWTEADFEADSAARKAALEKMASQMEAELVESMESHDE